MFRVLKRLFQSLLPVDNVSQRCVQNFKLSRLVKRRFGNDTEKEPPSLHRKMGVSIEQHKHPKILWLT